MGIKPFEYKDQKVTLQVPIPAVPGAYGELELNAKETATIALGYEIPVPLLDKVNIELQAEINKEGEIAYGVEANLAGLKLEAMIQGCNIVVDIGYGKLKTQAVFPIEGCEEPVPPELPELPPESGGGGDSSDEIIQTPLDLPEGLDPNKHYYFLVYCSVAKNVPASKTWSQGVSFNPNRNTEWHKVKRTDYGDVTFEDEFGWINDKGVWEGSGDPSYRSGMNSVGALITSGSMLVQMPFPTFYPPREGMSKDLQIRGFQGAMSGYYESWVHISTPASLAYSLSQDTVARAWWSSWQWGDGVLLTRSIIASPITDSPDTTPPLVGEPPMKDCCADIKKQLTKLRKELQVLTDTVSPPDFVETIFPPEYDDKGKLILQDKKKEVTLAEVLKELLKKSEIQIPTSYLAIPDPWKPKSWSDKLDSKTASILEIPEEKTIPLAFAFKAIYHALYKLLYVIDPDDMRFSRIPARFVKPGANPNENEDFSNYPEALALLYQMIDNYGFHPFRVQIDDTDLSTPGQQPSAKEYLSQGAAMKDILEQLGDMNAESNVQVELLVRLAYEIGLCHNVGADSQQKLQNIQDYLGFEIRKSKKDLKMAFNPLAGESAIHAAEKGEEALEDQLPGLLENSTMSLVVDEFSGSKTLQDFLMEILNAARQKPKGNRWG